jgi:uncharacterized protein with FMN-binding domain
MIATVGGLALLAGFHTGGGVKPNFVAAPAKSATSPTTGAPPPSSRSTTTTSPTTSTSSAGHGTTVTAPPTTPTTRATAQRVDGQVVDTQFGAVEVAVTLQSGRLTDVRALELPFEHQRSQEISQQVAPLLHDEALQAQSAQIDLVSGATYTSSAYAQSLQSALDQARA